MTVTTLNSSPLGIFYPPKETGEKYFLENNNWVYDGGWHDLRTQEGRKSLITRKLELIYEFKCTSARKDGEVHEPVSEPAEIQNHRIVLSIIQAL